MRRYFAIPIISILLLCAAGDAVASTATEFYQSLLQRGIAAFDAERYTDATAPLKLAAFGLVDSIEHYETAQVYLTLAYEKLNDPAKARDAARRVVAAERIQRRFSALPLPAGIVNSFTAAVTNLLGSSDAAYLRRPAPTQAATPEPAPQPPKPHASTEPKPQQAAATTPPATKAPAPAPAVPAPKNAAQASGTPAPATTANPQATVDPSKKSTEKPPEKPAPKPAEPPATKPAPPQAAHAPQVSQPKPIVPPPPTSSNASTNSSAAKPLSSEEASERLAAGERALSTAQLADARRAYRSLLDASGVSRETLIRVAEGLYRSRDFDGVLAAFSKIGSLRRGEEPYHYYMAVAYYETGKYERAKSELAAAIPFIEVTPDVARYRAKIDGALD